MNSGLLLLGLLALWADLPPASGQLHQANPICNLPVKVGPCLAYMPSYFYNSATKRCERFVYGGCQGNENRFGTMEECLKTCGSSALGENVIGTETKEVQRYDIRPAERVDSDICKLPVEPGPCKAHQIRYFYNSATKRCERFVYGGCQGNGNRFGTMEECLKTCGSSVQTGEHLAPSSGRAARCNQFCSTDADCPGSERCLTDDGCSWECKLPPGVTPGYCPKIRSDMMTICIVQCNSDRECGEGGKCCSLGCHVQCAWAVPAKPGTCPKKRVLQTFAPCKNKCKEDRDCPGLLKCCFTGCGLGCLPPGTGGVCQLPPDRGPCEARIPRFFYNPASRRCQRFYYGGCWGNGNNFRTLRECEQACGKPGPTRE